jgi:hypothetical protein
MNIVHGIVTSFNPATYTGSVLLLEATSAEVTNIPFATHIDGTSAQQNAFCAVLFFDESNPNDAVVLAIYPNGTSGVPTPPPGRTTFITPIVVINGDNIASGVTNTYTVGSPVPNGALGILFKVFIQSATAGVHIDIAAHGGNLSQTYSLGSIEVAGDTINGSGIVPLSSTGQIDVKANGGTIVVNLIVYGYIF